jgi:hypothetical protein
MIDVVTFEKTTYAKLPFKFEAGTPHIAGIIGLGEAIRWMEDYDKSAMAAHEHLLLEHATTELLTIDGLRIIGTAKEKVGVISFVDRRCSPLRPRHPARPTRHRCAHGPPLHPAADGALRCERDDAGELRVLQYDRRGGCDGEWGEERSEDVAMSTLNAH